MRGYRPPGFEVYFRSYRLFYPNRVMALVLVLVAAADGMWGTATLFAGSFGSGLLALRVHMWVEEQRHPGWQLLAYEVSNRVTRLAAFNRRPR